MTWLGAGKIFRGFKAPKKSKATQGRQKKKHFRCCKTLTKQGKSHVFRGKNEKRCVSLMSLEINRQKTKHDWLFLMINCPT